MTKGLVTYALPSINPSSLIIYFIYLTSRILLDCSRKQVTMLLVLDVTSPTRTWYGWVRFDMVKKVIIAYPIYSSISFPWSSLIDSEKVCTTPKQMSNLLPDSCYSVLAKSLKTEL